METNGTVRAPATEREIVALHDHFHITDLADALIHLTLATLSQIMQVLGPQLCSDGTPRGKRMILKLK